MPSGEQRAIRTVRGGLMLVTWHSYTHMLGLKKESKR